MVSRGMAAVAARIGMREFGAGKENMPGHSRRHAQSIRSAGPRYLPGRSGRGALWPWRVAAHARQLP